MQQRQFTVCSLVDVRSVQEPTGCWEEVANEPGGHGFLTRLYIVLPIARVK